MGAERGSWLFLQKKNPRSARPLGARYKKQLLIKMPPTVTAPRINKRGSQILRARLLSKMGFSTLKNGPFVGGIYTIGIRNTSLSLVRRQWGKDGSYRLSTKKRPQSSTVISPLPVSAKIHCTSS